MAKVTITVETAMGIVTIEEKAEDWMGAITPDMGPIITRAALRAMKAVAVGTGTVGTEATITNPEISTK